MKKLVIFSDLDGTLLDHSTYSFEKALPALDLIRQYNIPLILCSSKTRTEIEHYRKKLANIHPFISENGGGIFIPKNYFDFPFSSLSYPNEEEENYNVIRLGARYSDLRNVVKDLQQEGFEITGFGDMTARELADMTNLHIEEAVMAKERDFDEPFIFKGMDHELPHLFRQINKKGFNLTRGNFFHILGNSDKGNAMTLLSELYRKQFNELVTVAIGDSLNDLPMLERADYPVIVQKPDRSYDSNVDVPHLIKPDGIGPDGWNKALLTLTEMVTGQ